MAITDELREYAHDCCARVDDAIHVIADRIDAEHERECNEQHACGVEHGIGASIEASMIQERGYIELPKGTDGEHIRIGDVVEWTDGDGPHAREVTYLQLTSSGWYVGVKSGGLFGALELLRHHKQQTVEDVLTEFGIDWEHEDNCEDRAALLAEYAAKLRLAGENE